MFHSIIQRRTCTKTCTFAARSWIRMDGMNVSGTRLMDDMKKSILKPHCGTFRPKKADTLSKMLLEIWLNG